MPQAYTTEEAGRMAALYRARVARLRTVDPRKTVTAAVQRLVGKLHEEIARGHDSGAFLIALVVAVGKDFALDPFITLLMIIPYVGPPLAAIAQPILGGAVTLFLMLFLYGKRWLFKWKIRLLWWILGLFIDNLPAFSVLPMSVVSVLFNWHAVRKRARAAEKVLPGVHRISEQKIAELNEDISILDGEPIETPAPRRAALEPVLGLLRAGQRGEATSALQKVIARPMLRLLRSRFEETADAEKPAEPPWLRLIKGGLEAGSKLTKRPARENVKDEPPTFKESELPKAANL